MIYIYIYVACIIEVLLKGSNVYIVICRHPSIPDKTFPFARNNMMKLFDEIYV